MAQKAKFGFIDQIWQTVPESTYLSKNKQTYVYLDTGTHSSKEGQKERNLPIISGRPSQKFKTNKIYKKNEELNGRYLPNNGPKFAIFSVNHQKRT